VVAQVKYSVFVKASSVKWSRQARAADVAVWAK
jgi:hypothetical protein